MNTKELIEKEAREYAFSRNLQKEDTLIIKESFQQGAHFALSLFKWRKVSEGLPDKTGRYLCLLSDNYQNAEICIYNASKNSWGNSGYQYYGITHWMPIPEVE